MKYLVIWARDCDYSAWHIDADGMDNQEPRLCESLDEAREFLCVVATRNPDLVGRVYEISATYKVDFELVKPVVELTRREPEC